MLLELHTDFSGGRSGGLVFPSVIWTFAQEGITWAFFLCLFSLFKITLVVIAISSDCCVIVEVPTVIKAEKEWPIGKHVQFDILQGEQTNSLAKVPH